MTSAEAHQLLNAAKRGDEVPESQITEALRATGDIVDNSPFAGYKTAWQWQQEKQAA